jgi:hypothetical protein
MPSTTDVIEKTTKHDTNLVCFKAHGLEHRSSRQEGRRNAAAAPAV